jgi:hypothetical protein
VTFRGLAGAGIHASSVVWLLLPRVPRPIIESRVLLGSSARPPLRKHHKLGARVLHRPLQPQAAGFDVWVSVSDVE